MSSADNPRAPNPGVTAASNPRASADSTRASADKPGTPKLTPVEAERAAETLGAAGQSEDAQRLAERAAEALESRGWVKAVRTVTGGRPKREYLVNPSALEGPRS